MTYDDDFIRLNLMIGTRTIPLTDVGLDWPPPEQLVIDPVSKRLRAATARDAPYHVLCRVSMSTITDEQRADMSCVARGAEYKYTELSATLSTVDVDPQHTL